MYISGIFCDLAKVFDCVNHELLLFKLNHYGIQGEILDWFKSYLYNRKQRVEIKSSKHRIFVVVERLLSMEFLRAWY